MTVLEYTQNWRWWWWCINNGPKGVILPLRQKKKYISLLKNITSYNEVLLPDIMVGKNY
jgi:uncharacterized membrane protein